MQRSSIEMNVYELKNLDLKTANGSMLRCSGYSIMDLEINGRILRRPIIITSDNLGNEIVILGTNVLSELPEYKILYMSKEINTDRVEVEEITAEVTAENEMLQTLFEKHKDVFAKDDSDLGHTKRVTHRIRVIDETSVNKPYRRIPPSQIVEVREHIEALLKSGVITESQSWYACPVVVVRKKDGKLRQIFQHFRLAIRIQSD